MSNLDEYDFLFKLIIVGDSNVGKTNIMSKYIHNKFNYTSKSTIGVEFGTKIVKIDNKKIKAQIWDTAGQERYKSITSAYYKGAKGALIVYDITNKFTFESVDKWVQDLNSYGDKNLTLLLVGNKSDLEDKRQIMKEDGEEKAKSFNLGFIETSACSGDNIDQAFVIMLKEVLKKYIDENDINNDEFEASGGKNLELNKNNNNKKKKRCC
jgi:Ras-related protein Rab-11A